MGKDLKIMTPDGSAIYGRLDGDLTMPLVVIVHGLPCSIYEGIYEQAAGWFVQRGYAVFRFNLYGWQPDARQLIESTLESHAADLDTVIRHFRGDGVKRICVAGHSFGGPTVMLSKEQNFDAAVLWDPSYGLAFTRENYGAPAGRHLAEVNGYLMRWGASVVIGDAMAKEVDGLDWDTLPKHLHVPLLMIVAGKGVLLDGVRKYELAANNPKDVWAIEDATHYFDDTDLVRQKLYSMTKEWFDAHAPLA